MSHGCVGSTVTASVLVAWHQSIMKGLQQPWQQAYSAVGQPYPLGYAGGDFQVCWLLEAEAAAVPSCSRHDTPLAGLNVNIVLRCSI